MLGALFNVLKFGKGCIGNGPLWQKAAKVAATGGVVAIVSHVLEKPAEWAGEKLREEVDK